MATTAVSAELPIMLVVLGVAAEACTRQLNVFGDCNFVTGRTFDAVMCSGEWIRRLRVMVELPAIPAVGVVAGPTGFAECALVIVAIRMTIAADVRHARKIELGMTGFACGRRVDADQRKFREPVIERHRMPCDFRMAALAGLVPAAVGVVLLMTADAGLR